METRDSDRGCMQDGHRNTVYIKGQWGAAAWDAVGAQGATKRHGITAAWDAVGAQGATKRHGIRCDANRHEGLWEGDLRGT